MKNYRINPVAKDSDPVNVVDLHFDKCGLLRVDGTFEAKRIETAYNRYYKAMAQAAADIPALAGWKDLPAKKIVETEGGWENENGDRIFSADPRGCLAVDILDNDVFYIYGNFNMKLAGINPADVPFADEPAEVLEPAPATNDAEDSGKTITPAVAETASVTAAPAPCQSAGTNENPHADNSTNGGAVQQVISAEAYKAIECTAKMIAKFGLDSTLFKVELMDNNLPVDNFLAFYEEIKTTKDYKACLQRYLDQFNVIVAEPVKTEPPAQKPVVDAEPFISCYAPEPAKPNQYQEKVAKIPPAGKFSEEPAPAEPAPAEVKEPVKPSEPKPTDNNPNGRAGKQINQMPKAQGTRTDLQPLPAAGKKLDESEADEAEPPAKPKLEVVKDMGFNKIVQLPTRDELIDSLFVGGASDLAFAKRLEKFCGDRVKWCDEAKHWYLYSGGVWKKNSGENSAVSHFAADLAETMQQHAANDDEHKLAAAFQSAKKVGCSIGMLKACHSVRITLDDLDKHDELLNCLNGVVDLQTGKFYPDADPKLLLTKQAGAAYVPNAQSSLVEDFFTAIQPDEETRAGLLRWLGYCLTAKTNEHKFAVWTGERGANGKSTLSGVMLKLLGTYGTGLAPIALLKSNRPADPNTATTSLNPLENRRAAFVDELPLNAELDSALVKNLSGGGDINLRPNYSEFRTVPNLAKINISGNYLPRIENVNDGGIRRRLLNFAFNVRFGIDRPADPTLKEKLILPENLQALLALLVREAVAWYRGDGLIISDAMKAETQRQLDASNFVADFISDYYVKAPNASVKAKDFIDELKREYPRECSRFKRADLVKLIEAQDGVIYGDDRLHCRVFKGIGKAARDSDFDGEPVGKDVTTP